MFAQTRSGMRRGSADAARKQTARQSMAQDRPDDREAIRQSMAQDRPDDREAEALDEMYGCNGSSFTRNSRRLRPLYGLAGVGLEGARQETADGHYTVLPVWASRAHGRRRLTT